MHFLRRGEELRRAAGAGGRKQRAVGGGAERETRDDGERSGRRRWPAGVSSEPWVPEPSANCTTTSSGAAGVGAAQPPVSGLIGPTTVVMFMPPSPNSGSVPDRKPVVSVSSWIALPWQAGAIGSELA